ncbi:DUF5694 domain-containing protein [Alteromonas ponticola]|uniref:DUF5694 domain-containing protein n=1 Tax=Alteromonas aquimaris TaxID=2998417 RepID=A0ABT3P9U2_9ALTE|nr:DUF5694 domain-containing protein [Alteromonas aquimaris]MCW8109557.1 DUF5694 domain-containing protein [Alteromonas aquimaris]
MKKALIFWTMLAASLPIDASVKILPVGTFHFEFPNLDTQQVASSDQIDVLDPAYQKQIEKIVESLRGFNADYVVVEHKIDHAKELHEAYRSYLNTNQLPGRSETYQLGFRIAKSLSLSTVYGVDTWGKLYDTTAEYLAVDETKSSFSRFYTHPPDKALKISAGTPVYKEQGIAEELIRLNQADRIRQSLGNYLVGHFKYETASQPYFGADFESGRWFNRNLRIFRNLQRLPYQPGDKIILIYGAGHLNILNYLFDASPEFERVSALPYLEAAKDSYVHSND